MVLGVRKFIRYLKNLFDSDEPNIAYKKIGYQKYLKIRDENEIKIVDKEKVPQRALEGLDELEDIEEDNKELEEPKIRAEQEEPTPFSDILKQKQKQARQSSLENQHPKSVAKDATDNPYIFQDILDNPSLVDAETQAEAVETIAEANPGWAKMTEVTQIASEADPDVETADTETEAETESESDAETTQETSDTTGENTGIGVSGTLFGSLAEYIDSDTIDEAMDRCAGQVQ